jgi:5-methylthioadenosine/S-adenosylhomocysteine deaminase
MKIDLLITHCTLLADPGTSPLIDHAFVAIAGGRIAQTGPMTHCPTAAVGTVLDGQGQLAMPGLINAHCHAPMTLFRGLADDLDLATWLHGHIFPAEARTVNPEMVYWCAQLAAAEMLLSGITTVADGYFFEDAVARACAEVGLRCVAAQAVIDFPAPGVEDPKQNIAVAERFLDRWQGRHPLVTPAVFAHAPYTCGNQTLQRAKALARAYRAPLFLHAAETRTEQAQIAQPLAATPLGHLQALGILDRETICVHCVWGEEPDLDLLARAGAAVVTCPQSNAKLASGRAPLRAMLDRGLRIGLGTDGAASGNSLDLFREMDFAAKVHKVRPSDPVAVPARQLLHMATRGGADALGFATGLGTLLPGAPADLLLVDARHPQLQPLHSANLLVYSGCSAQVRTVIVAGQLVVHDRQLRTMDLDETCRRVRRLAGR